MVYAQILMSFWYKTLKIFQEQTSLGGKKNNSICITLINPDSTLKGRQYYLHCRWGKRRFRKFKEFAQN